MSPAMVPIAVGSTVTTVEELDALPLLTVIVADPDGRQDREDQRCLMLQKRADYGADPSWYAARTITKNDSAVSEEDSAVHGGHYGPFLVLWLPSFDSSTEGAA
ncbi:hypothetical protein [Arthrobacter sp. PsM3]|uniref:hypothetical protein n=1 Tax=Arthrobacter sp. PsM3 TaxID=3030531 RepID=UPI00263AF233|nr:hypothetical protein [Arthrobacter sp. PsM3]MDN4646122.1 hypothetical protein [Arthrobacter sp. PsM3]